MSFGVNLRFSKFAFTSIVVCVGAALLALVLFNANPVIRPRVLIVTAISLEEDPWIAPYGLTRSVTPGLLGRAFTCNEAATLCLMVSGAGQSNALQSLLLTGLSGNIDLSEAYVLVSGIAGTSPNAGTVGMVAWARWIADSGVAYEIDSRELPADRPFDRFELECGDGSLWCGGGETTGSEILHLDDAAAQRAYAISRAIPLLDYATVDAYRRHYPSNEMARRRPYVALCDIVSDDTYWAGKRMSAFASWWMKNWSNGAGTYCMTSMEDSGFALAARRLADLRRLDYSRVLMLRAASDFDQPYPGQSALSSLVDGHEIGGAGEAAQNAYSVGSSVVNRILLTGSL
jgi:purine nucleoside permease